MTPTRALHDAGQSLWLDNLTRTMLDDGTLERLIAEHHVSGMTSNPTIFDKAVASGAYDAQIAELEARGLRNEEVFFELAASDLRRACRLFADVHRRTAGFDGFVSLEVSPELAYDTEASIAQAAELHELVGCPNLYIKIPGTPQGLAAIEETVFAGIPVNVTLLFSSEQHMAAADAYHRALERRIIAGLAPDVPSVASLFVSRWDVAVAQTAPPELRGRLGLAIGGRAYVAYRALLGSDRVRRLMNAGARPQRLLWASTGTKDPDASDTLYVDGLAAPGTVNTMPDATLRAYADHGVDPPVLLPRDGGDAEAVIAGFERSGEDVGALASRLQREGSEAFVKSWRSLLQTIQSERSALAGA
ncbi:MAG: transaldolase [Solirubrobacteraceae bacterium]|nr:transaldolase [Solirubrobacteraceae bacterium]